MFNQSSDNHPNSRLSVETKRSSKEISMSPRVTVSPLRCHDIRTSQKLELGRLADTHKPTSSHKGKGRPLEKKCGPLSGPEIIKPSEKGKSSHKGRLSEKGRLLSGSEKKRLSGSETGSPSEKSRSESGAASAQRRRSRNIQLTSLFDSLTRFFSADSGHRRRTAYVNATVSLAQSSFNPRHNFSLSPPARPKPQLAATEKQKSWPAKRTPSPHRVADEPKLKVRH